MKPCPLISILTLLNYVEWKCKARHVDAKCLFINSIKPDFDGWFVCLIIVFSSIFIMWMFVWFGCIVPLENVSLIKRRHHCLWRMTNLETYARHCLVRVLKRATPTLTKSHRLWWSFLRTRDTHTYCRAFSSGAVTTWFYDLVLSWLGFEHPNLPL